MPIQPIYERFALDDLGYIGGWAEVRVNPSKAELQAYYETLTRILIPEPPDGTLSPTEQQAWAKQRDAEAEDAFMRARLAVFGKVKIGKETWDLSTEAGYRRFEVEGDAAVAGLLDSEFARRRKERLDKSVNSFRGANGTGPDAAGGTSQKATAA
jgi:hypothetical protein